MFCRLVLLISRFLLILFIPAVIRFFRRNTSKGCWCSLYTDILTVRARSNKLIVERTNIVWLWMERSFLMFEFYPSLWEKEATEFIVVWHLVIQAAFTTMESKTGDWSSVHHFYSLNFCAKRTFQNPQLAASQSQAGCNGVGQWYLSQPASTAPPQKIFLQPVSLSWT